MKEKTGFMVDTSKCIKCGKCLNTCSGMVLEFDSDSYPEHYIKIIVGFGYPEIKYARGVQKDRSKKVHRYSKEVHQQSLF